MLFRSLPDLSLPDMSLPDLNLKGGSGSGSGAGAGVGGGAGGAGVPPGSALPTAPDAGLGAGVSPPDEQRQLPVTPPDPQTPADPNMATPLGIPDQALDTGDVSFMNGHWRSLTGLMETRTGTPIAVEYDFQDGQGRATINRSDGVACQGPAGATIQGRSLVISQQGNLVCTDGSAFAPSDVQCTLDENQDAVCQGQYPGGDKYDVEIVR